ncbi:MAG: hypothetical protein IPK07_05260 [Deltaproteobacteria bacterium]|nr:hypothetical protein [Deltaproteobacteria bacterium]
MTNATVSTGPTSTLRIATPGPTVRVFTGTSMSAITPSPIRMCWKTCSSWPWTSTLLELFSGGTMPWTPSRCIASSTFSPISWQWVLIW